MATLIVVGKRSTREHPLTDHVTVIGRDEGVSLDLGDLQVSRRHALVVAAAQGFFVKDLGSRNGMTLNQLRIPSRQQAQLKNGDVLSLGRTTLIFKDLKGSPAATIERPLVPKAAPQTTIKPQPPKQPDAPLAESSDGDVLELVEEIEDAPAIEARRTPLSVDVVGAEVNDTTDTPARVDVPGAAPRGPAPRKRPSGKIPKALAPGAAPSVYSGPAEVLTLRALMERAERDRVFYRNLSLILFCLLIGTLVILFAWALANREPAKQEAAQANPEKTAATQPAPRVAAANRARLDPRVFAAEVHPVLTAKCVQCHNGAGGGNLLLASANDIGTIAANAAAVRRFVVPGEPKRSPLLLKPIATTEGGSGAHPVVLAVGSSAWRALQSWVATTVQGSPPRARIAAPKRARAGQSIAFDGSSSVDPDGKPLVFRWSLVQSPSGSQAALRNMTAKTAQLTPDRPGRYSVALVVQDGTASGSTTHTLQVVPGADAPPTAPPTKPAGRDLSGTFRKLLGRSPTSAERDQVASLHGRELHTFFLAQTDLYERWWASELTYLGLIGEHAPRGEPWDSLPQKLLAKRYAVPDVHYALMVGSSWQSAYPGREAYVDALLVKMVGKRQLQANLRDSALKLYDGYEASLLGETVKGQIGLVRAVVHSPQAQRHLIQRSYQRLIGRAPAQELVDANLKRLRAKTATFFQLLVEWTCV